ncbi:hypothetical protein KAR91_44595 [Candidatus Pacearchaeota archaeon]|nr:hypothetical protein [Candidatus Pacearchaeota archaeon]
MTEIDAYFSLSDLGINWIQRLKSLLKLAAGKEISHTLDITGTCDDCDERIGEPRYLS